MSSWRKTCLERLTPAAVSSAALLKELTAIVEELDFEYCSYVLTIPTPITNPRVAWASNYPNKWVDRYFSKKYMEVDPIVLKAVHDPQPVVWNSDSFDVQPEFWEEARTFGIRHGWALVGRGPNMETGLLSVARSRQAITPSELDEKEVKLVWLSQMMQGLIGESEFKTFLPEAAYQLTARECEVLRWSAEGKTAEEIGTILGISARTVTFHMTSSMYKLDVTNKTQAVAKAVLLKLI
jgi:DNA-binding CsgD family transcriptional regulator